MKKNIYISQEQEIIRKRYRDFFLLTYLGIIHKYLPSEEYYSYYFSQVLKLTNYSYSYSHRSWLHKSIPIPIHRKKKKLFAENCLGAEFKHPKTNSSIKITPK